MFCLRTVSCNAVANVFRQTFLSTTHVLIEAEAVAKLLNVRALNGVKTNFAHAH